MKLMTTPLHTEGRARLLRMHAARTERIINYRKDLTIAKEEGWRALAKELQTHLTFQQSIWDQECLALRDGLIITTDGLVPDTTPLITEG